MQSSLAGRRENYTGRNACAAQLAAGIAHNFNNLLTSMMCGSAWALGRLPDDHPARTAVEAVSRSSEQAADLVRQLMAYAGIGPFAPSPVDLSQLAARTESFRASLSPRVRLRPQLASRLPLVWADSSLIERLIQVLLTNAVEAIGDGPGTVWIRTRAAGTGGPAPGEYFDAEWPASEESVCLEVSDTGCGMDDWVMRQIFDPFFSTKSLGRGLGLAAAAGIARKHRAVVRVESAPGSGSIFRVYFPVYAPYESAGTDRAA